MRVLHVVAETPLSFLQHLRDITFIEKKPLKWVKQTGRPPPLELMRPHAGSAPNDSRPSSGHSSSLESTNSRRCKKSPRSQPSSRPTTKVRLPERVDPVDRVLMSDPAQASASCSNRSRPTMRQCPTRCSILSASTRRSPSPRSLNGSRPSSSRRELFRRSTCTPRCSGSTRPSSSRTS